MHPICFDTQTTGKTSLLKLLSSKLGFENAMFHKVRAVFCLAAILVLAGCGSEKAAMKLPGTTWQIEDIDKAGIVDRSMITLQFSMDGGVAGSGGCNRYFGGVSLQSDQLSFSQLGSAPQDSASETRLRFNCEGVGTVEVRFVGAETLELTRDGVTAILQRMRSASGARYVGDEVGFWNKGDEAMLNLSGVDQRWERGGIR